MGILYALLAEEFLLELLAFRGVGGGLPGWQERPADRSDRTVDPRATVWERSLEGGRGERKLVVEVHAKGSSYFCADGWRCEHNFRADTPRAAMRAAEAWAHKNNWLEG